MIPPRRARRPVLLRSPDARNSPAADAATSPRQLPSLLPLRGADVRDSRGAVAASHSDCSYYVYITRGGFAFVAMPSAGARDSEISAGLRRGARGTSAGGVIRELACGIQRNGGP